MLPQSGSTYMINVSLNVEMDSFRDWPIFMFFIWIKNLAAQVLSFTFSLAKLVQQIATNVCDVMLTQSFTRKISRPLP